MKEAMKYIRLAALVTSFIVTVIMEVCGATLPLEIIALSCTFVLAGLCAWKNNDFTWAAKVGTSVMQALKDGKITEDEVKGILGTKNGEEVP